MLTCGVGAGDGNDWGYGNGGDDIILSEDGDDNLRGDFNDRAENKIFADVNGDDYILTVAMVMMKFQVMAVMIIILGGAGNDHIFGDYGTNNKQTMHIAGNDYL